MKAFTDAELDVYRRLAPTETVPLSTALAWARAMKQKKKAVGRPPEKKPAYMQKIITGPEETIKKGVARAKLLGRSFSGHVMRLIEEDYARDQVVVMTVAERSPEYQRFREEHPPIPLKPEPDPGQNESQPEGDN